MSLESMIIWGAAAVLCAVIPGAYWLSLRRGGQRNSEELAEAVSLGINQPIAQHPQVQLSSCIGCGACVAACPEGVLGMISGKARIINGLRCIGHGLCADACPVEAIQIGLGDAPRDDIPYVDEHLQTSVPGVYIAGELGGMALVKNAILQGRQAAEHAALGLPEAGSVVIVGAGPAGMAAALTLTSAGIRPLLLDQEREGGSILQYPRKKIVLTQPVDLPGYGRLSKTEYTKEALLEIFQEALSSNQLTVQGETRVSNIEPSGTGLLVKTNHGDLPAQRVILALGRRGSPRKLGVPGEERTKVAYQLLDAGLYHDEDILVVGGGDSAVEAALALCLNNRVVLSYRKHAFFRIKKRNAAKLAMADTGLEQRTETQLLEIGEDHVKLQTKQGVETLPNNRVFIFAGGVPPFGLLRTMGIAFGREEVTI